MKGSQDGDDKGVRPLHQTFNLPSALVLGGGIALLVISANLFLQLLRVKARESIIEARQLTLSSPIKGIIQSLDVQAGDQVSQGTVLFSVENRLEPKPRVGDLQIELTTAETTLQATRMREARAEKVHEEATRDLSRQSKLQISRQQEELNALKRRLHQAMQEAAFAQRNHVRRNQLYRQGAMAFDEVDRAATNLAQAREEVRLTENRIKAQERVLRAAQLNLTLIATRGGADPETQQRDTRLALANIREEREAQERRVKTLREQLKQAQKEYEDRRLAVIRSPIDGVVWSVKSHAGSNVSEQEVIVHLLDCTQRWINTYVREGDLKTLRIGQEAEIILYGSSRRFRGTISSIRSGIGRSSAGKDVTPLLPINMYRESQVKVDLKSDSESDQDPKRFCYSGYTGKVTFQP